MPRPALLDAPTLEASPVVIGALRISLRTPAADPAVSHISPIMRAVGTSEWLFVDSATDRLVSGGGSAYECFLGTTEISVRGVEEGVAYECAVQAMNAEGWSDASPVSAPAFFGTLRVSGRPEIPAVPRLDTTDTGLRVRWAVPAASPEVTNVAVWMRAADSEEWLSIDAGTSALVPNGSAGAFDGSVTEAVIQGLAAGRSYECRILAMNTEGWSDPSEVGAGYLGDGGRPGAPKAPLVEAVPGGIKVQFDAPTAIPEVTHFNLMVRVAGGSDWVFIDSETHGLAQRRCKAYVLPVGDIVLQGLEEGIKYEIAAEAGNAAGLSVLSPCGPSIHYGVAKEQSPPPRAPRPTLEATADGLLLHMAAPQAAPAVTHLAPKIRVVGTKTWKIIDSDTDTIKQEGGNAYRSTVTDLPVRNAEEGVAYEVSLAALNGLGWGEESEVSEPVHFGMLKQRAPPPCSSRPTLAVLPDGLRVRLCAPVATPPVDHLALSMRIVGTQEWLHVDSLSGRLLGPEDIQAAAFGALVTHVDVQGCLAGVPYECMVRAMNTEGWGESSDASEPVYFGTLKRGSPPPRPEKPSVEKLEDGFRVRFRAPEAWPAVKAISLNMKAAGAFEWLVVDSETGSIVKHGEGGDVAFGPLVTEAVVKVSADSVHYECILRAYNDEGWSEVSEVGSSAPEVQEVLV